MHQEGMMTARSSRQSRAVARKPDPEPLCVIILMAGVVLAALAILRFWT